MAGGTPGQSQCRTSPGSVGVVLLGLFGSSSWCPPGSGSMVAAPSNLVRLGPLPANEPAYASLPKTVRNGVALYAVVLHGTVAGTAYLVPSLSVEVMASGPGAPGVLASIGPSIRAQVLAAAPSATPATWRHFAFAGLNFAVPPSWPINNTTQVYDCQKMVDNVGLLSPANVILDTDTARMALPCPYFPSPRNPANGLVVDAGTALAPNSLPVDGAPVALNGLHAFIDDTDQLSVLLLEVEVPGRSMPVAVRLGLGSPVVASHVPHAIKLT